MNLEVMCRAEEHQSETFRGWYQTQRRNTTQVKFNDSKMISPFDTVGNITSTSRIEHNSDIKKYL